MAKDTRIPDVFWSLAYVDWYQDQQPTHEEAFKKLTGRIHPGAIVLLHNTSSTNAEILDELLTKWGRNGIFFRLSRSARIEICLRTGNTVSHVFLSFFCSAFLSCFQTGMPPLYFLPEPQHTEQVRHRHAGIGKLRKIPDRFRHADAPGKRCKAEENTVNHSEAILFHQPEKRLLPWYAQPAIVANANSRIPTATT